MRGPAESKSGGAGHATARPEVCPGVVLQGTYRILHSLATGGMGEVYAAAHERLAGSFAVKVLHKELVHDEEALSRFRSEAEIMAGLHHPNIVQVFDFNLTAEGTPYLVMELVEGKDLSQHLCEGEPMLPARVAGIVRQVASALEAAHARGIVHRDLKPENVMLVAAAGQAPFVKVVDFGISKTRRTRRITAESAILGTPQFMAPEQAQGRQDDIDHRTDQFALASMAYTLLTGHEPFRGDTAVTILYQVVHQDAEPIARHVRWHCARVDAVLARAMAKEREARYPSVLAFAAALEQAVEEDGAETRRPTVESPHLVLTRGPSPALRTIGTGRIGRPRPRLAAVGLVAAVLMAAYGLNAIGWQTIGTAFGVAYDSAAAATSRTVGRWRAPAGPRTDVVLPSSGSSPP